MESQTVDARGMACPIPVINTKKALENMEAGLVTTIVDNDAAKENIIALAKSLACEVDVEQKEKDYYIQITKTGTCMVIEDTHFKKTVIFITSSELGRGSDELGAILMKSFLFTVLESDELPTCILFANSGVKLTCEDSPVIEHMMQLQNKGVEILSCGTCLDFFKLKEKLCIGQVTNMYTILEKMNQADKVINL